MLEVILRKAAKIREELGVPVPLPDDGHTLTQALMRAVFLRRRETGRQMMLDFSDTVEAKAIDDSWQDAAEKAKKNRTVFAQRRLKPEHVLPEWRKSLSAIGGRDDVERFVSRALSHFGSGLEPMRRGAKAPLAPLPEDIRERLEAEGLQGTLLIDFDYPAAQRCKPVQRSHPLVAVLAEGLIERTLGARDANGDSASEENADPAVLGRVGAWVSAGVEQKTTVALLRLRHQLIIQRAGLSKTLLVEEAFALAWVGGSEPTRVEGADAMALLSLPPEADPPPHVRGRTVKKALDLLANQGADLDELAERRAQALLADHRRVREAADARGSYQVKVLLPVDVIGLYVLLPRLG